MAQTSIGHKTLWHADFLKIILANFCVCTSLYMFLPVAPVCMGRIPGEDVGGMCASVLLFWGGVCLPAPFCNYWLDAYRRKNVALWALAARPAHRLRTTVYSPAYPHPRGAAALDNAGGYRDPAGAAAPSGLCRRPHEGAVLAGAGKSVRLSGAFSSRQRAALITGKLRF